VCVGGARAAMSGDRQKLREHFVADLAALGKEATVGEMPATELRRRLVALLDRYLGLDWRTTTDLEPAIDDMLRQYEGLHDAVERQAFLENLGRLFGA
jgi:hypothetical protein